MKKLIISILVVMLILGLLWVLADLWSRKQLKEACADWPLLDRSLADLAQVVPRTSWNQSARDLEALYERIRFDVKEDGQAPSQKDQEAASAMRSTLEEYLNKELKIPMMHIEAPPADIMEILTYNKDVLGDIAHRLVNDEPPELARDVEAGLVPNLLWHIRLNRMLIVQALSWQATGKTDQAWSYLYASTRLADALFAQPQLISQLLAISEAQQILLSMRKMPAPIPSWALRWPSYDFEHGMLMAFTTEARSVLTMADDPTELRSRVKTEFDETSIFIDVKIYILSSVVARPLNRLCLAHNIIPSWKQVIRKGMQQGLCSDQSSKRGTMTDQSSARGAMTDEEFVGCRWSVVGIIAKGLTMPFFSWRRVHRVLVYQTGTHSILAAKAAKAKSPSKRWPETLSEIALPCERLAWSYTVTSDGSVKFQYSQPISPEIPAGYLTYFGDAEE